MMNSIRQTPNNIDFEVFSKFISVAIYLTTFDFVRNSLIRLFGFHFCIRQPLLAMGTKAAGLGLVRFLTIRGHAFQLSS